MTSSSRESYRDKMSQMIGEYLLKGYTMLNAYCPECNSPLMRFRQDESICVICRDFLKENVATGGGHSASPSVKVETDSLTTSINNSSNKRPAINGSQDSQAEEQHKRNARQPSIFPELQGDLQKVVTSCSRKLVWIAERIGYSTDYAEIARLNELLQQTVATIEKVNQLAQNV